MFPDLPCCNTEDFKEERMVELILSLADGVKVVQAMVPLNAKEIPANRAVRALEKEVVCGLLNRWQAKHTGVVFVVTNLVVSSF